MTPLQLHVLMHSYTSSSWEGMEHLHRGNSTWIEQTNNLIDSGMISCKSDIPSSCPEFPYKITEKGKIWFQHILSISLPVQEWKIPNA